MIRTRPAPSAPPHLAPAVRLPDASLPAPTRSKDRWVDGFSVAPAAHKPCPPLPSPVPAADFEGLCQAMERQPNDAGKLELLRSAAIHAHFSVDQACRLVDLLTFSAGKLDVAQILAPRLVDRWNSHRFVGKWVFTSDQARVRAIIDAAPPLPIRGRGAMSEVDFGSLVEGFEGQPFKNEKLALLRSAARDGLFTADQVGRFLDLMPFTSDKLTLVEIGASRIVDRFNNYRIVERFTFTSDQARARAILDAAPPLPVEPCDPGSTS